jgi:hypothetical protein
MKQQGKTSNKKPEEFLETPEMKRLKKQMFDDIFMYGEVMPETERWIKNLLQRMHNK